jgi:hypothetical protein
MDEWIWGIPEMVVGRGKLKCPERNLPQCYFII